MKPLNELRIAVCNDHAGYNLKTEIINYLKTKNPLQIKDFGCFSSDSADYPDFAHPMASAVENGEFDFGISICGSGNGISITVNKHQHIRLLYAGKPKLRLWLASTTMPTCYHFLHALFRSKKHWK
jgi:ribose 5-phosphate isomerase B